MRKSTVVAIAVIIFGAISMMFLFRAYTERAIDEVRNAKELTDLFRPQLSVGTKIRLRRTPGDLHYVVRDPAIPGLLVEAQPSAAVLTQDRSGFQFAREVASRAFELYGADRPIRWVEVKLTRPDGTRIASIGLERGEGTAVVPVEPAPPR